MDFLATLGLGKPRVITNENFAKSAEGLTRHAMIWLMYAIYLKPDSKIMD